MTIEVLQEFLGWCTVINIGILILSSIVVVTIREPVLRIHSKLFRMKEEQLVGAYFQYLAQFKIAVLIFNLVPYLALALMDKS